jgi:CRP-like cAMP-binding protein
MLVSEAPFRAAGAEAPPLLDPLFAGAAPIRLGTQELLYMPEEPARHVYLVVDGELRLYKVNAEGREFTLGLYGPGEIVGETEALTGSRRACYAMARVPAQLLALDQRQFLSALDASPVQALRLARFVSRKNRLIERKLESLLFKSAHAKVAEQLLALAEQHAKPAPAESRGAVDIDYPITHQEIANLIGATRETVSYVLLDFKAMSLIHTGRRRIAIRDLAGLREMASAS